MEALLDDPACSVDIQSGQNLWKYDVNDRSHENAAARMLTSSRTRI